MIEIRDILYPTDFSEASRHALDHASTMAGWYGSRILALHVMPVLIAPPAPMVIAGLGGAVASPVEDRQSCEEELRAWLAPARAAGVTMDAVVDEGGAAARILEHARSRPADLIVMGTHGRSGFERFVVGSVAEKVLRQAGCPVMTVPPTAATAAKVPYTRLLCPVDFSDVSLTALRFAFSLAKEADASLTILHVIEWPPEGDAILERINGGAIRRQVAETARVQLDALISDDVRNWCKPFTQIVSGKPYRRILELAATGESDLIILGARGRSPLDLMFFGSTASHVVRRAPCPVLTLMQ